MAKGTKRTPEEITAVQLAKAQRSQLRARRRVERRAEDSERAWAKYQRELGAESDREVQRQMQSDGMDWLEGRDTEGARRFAAAVSERQEAVQRSRTPIPLVSSKPIRAVRKAEAAEFDRKRSKIKDAVEDVGTGQTILKMRPRPIPKLVDEGKLGQTELEAAREIETAFNGLTAGLASRGINYDRVDCGRGDPSAAWLARNARIVARYQAFAKVWTDRNNDYGDPTLAILIDAIIDQRWMRTLANDHGCRVEKVERAIIGGLRDYAARAGFVTGHQAQRWRDEAAAVFGAAWLAAGGAHQGPAEYRKAIRRAAVES